MVLNPAASGEASSRSPRPLSIVIVDDHALLRMGTRQILNEAEGMQVVAEAADAAEALDAVRATHPDIVLVDIRLPDQNGIEVARQVVELSPATKVVVLSAYDDEDYVRAAIEAGVSGYLLKTMPGDELVRAVRAAASGTTVLDPAVTANLTRPRTEPSTGWHRLSDLARAASRAARCRGPCQQDHRDASSG